MWNLSPDSDVNVFPAGNKKPGIPVPGRFSVL